MDQNKVGNLIKELRTKNKLTQEKFAEKYGVTYQAVSKWENGKNIPDISLLKEICKDFNIDINDLLEGNNKKIKNKKNIIIISVLSILLIILVIFLIINKNDNFTFKTVTSNCSNFEISGSIAYNNNKQHLYISNVNYCGEEDNTNYKEIECTLYENSNSIKKEIGKYKKEENITLNEFLKSVNFTIEDFTKECKILKEDSLTMEINATDNSGKITTYKIPLTLKPC